jgi:hypothetical protein
MDEKKDNKTASKSVECREANVKDLVQQVLDKSEEIERRHAENRSRLRNGQRRRTNGRIV